MKTATIKVEIGTVDNGKLVRNTITLEIPKEAALLISKAWNTNESPQHNTIVAHGLMANQIASCDLVIGNEMSAGILNMPRENSDWLHCLKVRKC